jgi:hypothetical protein
VEGLGDPTDDEEELSGAAASTVGWAWLHALETVTTARRNAEVVVRRRIRRDARVTVTG